MPYDFSNSDAVVVGTDIYILGGFEDSHYNYVYKYDTITDTYTQLENIPFNFQSGGTITINNNIYLLGGTDKSNANYLYIHYIDLPQIDKYQYNEIITTEQLPTTPENDNIYIIFGSTYATKLLEQLVLNFTNVQLYKKNETQLYPIYYGNGEEWIKILN